MWAVHVKQLLYQYLHATWCFNVKKKPTMRFYTAPSVSGRRNPSSPLLYWSMPFSCFYNSSIRPSNYTTHITCIDSTVKIQNKLSIQDAMKWNRWMRANTLTSCKKISFNIHFLRSTFCNPQLYQRLSSSPKLDFYLTSFWLKQYNPKCTFYIRVFKVWKFTDPKGNPKSLPKWSKVLLLVFIIQLLK